MLIALELHEVKTGKKKFRNTIPPNSNSPSKSFRNSRDDRGSRYSRDDRREESTTVTCSDCGTECPEMIEVQDIPEMIEVQDIPEMTEEKNLQR
jgi:hypothetical protein